MPIAAYDGETKPRSPGWSNRILLAAIAGILFLTLYPFKFSLHAHLPLKSSPFLLGSGIKRTTALDFSLNVLLFVPFGFGLCSKLRQKKWSWTASLFASWLAGAFFSYAIEFAQIYVPLRDSGWEDIFSNTTGSILGALLFASTGGPVLRLLSRGEEHLESSLSVSWTWVLLFAYFTAWLAVSVPLQRQTNLSNWEPNANLLVGNDGSLANPWKGQVLRLQIWDHAIPHHHAQEVTSRGLSDASGPVPLADYNFSLGPPVRDQQGFLSDLSWISRLHSGKTAGPPAMDGTSWMMSQSPVTDMTEALRKTNQFTVRLVCRTAMPADGEGAIVSIAQRAGKENLSIWQDGAYLAFWFRKPLTTNTWHLRWSVSDVFVGDQPRDILISYDGSNLSVFVDGKRDRHRSQLGPGVALASLFHRGKPGEVQIYDYIYYVAVFLPAGCILGILARKATFRDLAGPILLSCLIAPLALEGILVYVSGRSYSIRDFVLSSIFVTLAFFWINADRHFETK